MKKSLFLTYTGISGVYCMQHDYLTAARSTVNTERVMNIFETLNEHEALLYTFKCLCIAILIAADGVPLCCIDRSNCSR